MTQTIEKVKAAAYDCLAQIEQLQIRLRELNNFIANYKEEPEAPKAPTEDPPKA